MMTDQNRAEAGVYECSSRVPLRIRCRKTDRWMLKSRSFGQPQSRSWCALARALGVMTGGILNPTIATPKPPATWWQMTFRVRRIPGPVDARWGMPELVLSSEWMGPGVGIQIPESRHPFPLNIDLGELPEPDVDQC